MNAQLATLKLSGYQELIREATGVLDLEHLERIEDIMRNVIFHSTLDWQSRAQLEKAAREAMQILTLI
ncbi:MAG: hypothetical protein CVU21_05485 [Betaproteobacteria bacterium HGW-Betaproteobacteria-15]|nr:MAG: hypothetical protein CVU21_05485 [Betaproteobacteria bacterium HGW-Betaproteobacteria-15]